MAKRSLSQRIGDQAENIAQGRFLSAPNWICRSQTHDFGIDLEAELVENYGGSEELSAAILKLQVKGTLKPIYQNGAYCVRVSTQYLRYANQFRVPVVLLLVDVSKNEIFYLWIQEYLIGREEEVLQNQSVLVRIPEGNRLEDGFQTDLPDIAMGVARGAQFMALQRMFEVFSAKYDRVAVDLCSVLLKHLGDGGYVSIFNAAIHRLIKRGSHLSRADSNEQGKILRDLTQRFGNELTSDQIVKMIVRGEYYSAAGFDGLIGLYDSFADHAASLSLASKFDELELYELSWYCRFREEHSSLMSIELWGAIRSVKTDFDTGMGCLFIPEELKEDFYYDWPNKSDMAYFKYLRRFEPNNEKKEVTEAD